MPRNFNLGAPRLAALKDPRVIMRVMIGVLLVANLAAAVAAFKPFGGSADDLRREQQRQIDQLRALQSNINANKTKMQKVEAARTQGGEFLDKYFMDIGKAPALILEELSKTATESQIKMGQASFERRPIEGSDTLLMLTFQVGFEGSYTNLTKFMNLVDRSPRFLIIENMQAAAPQGQVAAGAQSGQSLNVSLKIDAFIKDLPVTTAAAL